MDRSYYFKLSNNKQIEVTQKDIDDIMSVALEGRINYWCKKSKLLKKYIYGEYASDQISRNGSLELYDIETDDVYILTLDKFLSTQFLMI